MASTMFLFPLLLLAFLELVGATHFAYATIQWTCVSGCPYSAAKNLPRNYSIQNSFGYRRSFPWYSNGAQVNVGSVVNPGDLAFYAMDPTQTLTPSSTYPVQLLVQTLFTADDWFMGQYNLYWTTPGNYAKNWRSYFSNCCRLSSIRDKNNDVPWTVTGIYNKMSTVSPVAIGLPRIYCQQYIPLQYTVPWLSPSGLPIVISLASQRDSTLVNKIPLEPPSPPNATFTYNKATGTCNWTPTVTGLYAIAFFVEEVCASVSPGDVPCADSNLIATGNGNYGAGPVNATCCTRVPLDFIFEVDPGCAGQPNCVNPPYFILPFDERTTTPDQRVWYFYRGIEGSFKVCATDDSAGQIVSIDFGLSPPTSTLTQIGQNAQTTCYLFKWAPTLTDQDTYLCAVATATPGYRGSPLKSLGNYCIKLVILDASLLVVSGIVRDFHYYHPNFNRSYADCRQCNSSQNPIANSWVASKLDANHKPVYTVGSPTKSTWGSGLGFPANSTAAGFYDWWTTDPATTNPRNVQVPISIILSSGANINQAIFTFLSSAFFPIDGQGFGNEGSTHNYFYTYELNLYITYLNKTDGGGMDQIMNVAAQDDLWIFIDNVLVPNWNQHGIKPSNATSGAPYDYTVNMATLLGSDGFPLVTKETYRCDIFYANRFGTPYLKIELPNNTLCTQLTSGQYAFNWTSFAGVNLTDGSTGNIPPTGLFYYAISTPAPQIAAITRPSNGKSVQALKLFDKGSQGASVWYGTPLKALHGFIATFTFFVNNPNKLLVDGFAFVLNSYPYYRGNVAEQLGYGGLQKTFAVEIDMLQSSLIGDPDFTTCCGNYPYWDAPASGWGSTLPYGQVAYHAKLSPVSGSYVGNDASEAVGGGLLASGSSSGKIALDFKNGSEYTMKVVYQPAQDDGTSNPQPGWFWTYANLQLEPVVATQVDGVLLRAMLGGATTVGFTSGGQFNTNTGTNPAGYGADIWILDWSMLIVPTDAGSTQIISAQILGQPIVNGATNPITPVIAGQTSMVTVRARDACGNPITVGGELNLFTCTVLKTNCPQTIPCTGVDNNDGTYTFSFQPTIASPNYQLYISFGSPALAIKGSPYPFAVIAAPANVNTSIAVFGQLPELLYNGGNDPFNGNLRQQGIFAVRFSQYGRVNAWQMFDFLNALDSYNGGTVSGAVGLTNFISGRQASEYVVIAVSGSDVSTSLITNTGLNNALNTLYPGNKFAQIKSGNAYALIARPGNQPTCIPACESLTPNVTKISARGIDNSSLSFTRNFTLYASSANTDCGPWAVINSIFDDIRVPAGTNNQFTIQARDIYGNLNPLTVIASSFQPDLVPSTGGALTFSPLFPTTGYFVYPFYSEKAGDFFMYTGLDGAGANIRYGNGLAPFGAYPVKIDPGLANITNSYCQGSVLTTTTAGVVSTVQLVLFDRWSNQITFMNPYDNISATLIFRNNGTIVTPLNTSWQDGSCGTKCVLFASFYPTKASILNDPNVQFDVNFTVNGYWKICGSPDIVPGPLSPANCTFDLSGVTPNPSPAGTTTTFTITTRDRFGNQRRTPTAAGDVLNVTFAPAVISSSISYAGNGLYTVAVTPKTEGNDSVTVSVIANGNGDVKPSGTYPVGTQPLRVVPGPAAPNTTYQNIAAGRVVVAGTLNEFNLTSYDQYMNLRDNQPYNYPVALSTDYFVRLNEPTKGVDAMIQLKTGSTYATTGIYTYQYNATLVGSYTLTLQTTPVIASPTVQTINNSPVTPIIVIPACTYFPNTIFGGPGLGGGASGTQANFTMTARDIFTNVQADWRDKTLYNVTIKPSTGPTTSGTIVNAASAGNFVVNYTVPTAGGSAPVNFTIIVCHNGLNSSTSPVSVCYPSMCTNFTAYAVNTNRAFNGTIAVTNGTAGTPMNWVIRDIDPVTGVAPTVASGNIVTSWLVTVTRVSDGAPAAQSIQVSCFKGSGQSCVYTPEVYTNVSFTPTTNIGLFKVQVFAYGIETEQSKAGIQVTIGPGPVYPPNCVVFNLPATIQAGATGQTYEVALKDQWFHNITANNLVVLSSLTSPDGKKTVNLTASYNSANNHWVFTYGLNTTGVWPALIWESISLPLYGYIGSSLQVTVTPGQASCKTSYIMGVATPPTVFATAGSPSVFTIVPLDQFGNPVVDPSTTFALADVNGIANFSQAVTPSAFGNGAINIQVTWTPYKVNPPPANNTLQVQIGGCNLIGTIPAVTGDVPQNSPLSVLVNPADIYPPLSNITGGGSSVSANTSLVLTVTLKDKYGNSWFSDRPGAITGLVTVPSSGQQYAAATSAQGNGVYTLTLSPTATQVASAYDLVNNKYLSDYSWVVTANGAPLSGPTANGLIPVANETVQAGPTAPFNTIPPTLVDIISDTNQVYQVILQDAFGNRKYQGADSDVVAFTWIDGSILCQLGEEIPPSNSTAIQTVAGPTSVGHGAFNVTIMGTKVGGYTLNLTVTPAATGVLGYYGQPNCAPTSRLVQQVLPGAAYPPTSYWTIDNQVVPAGGTVNVFVQVNDKQGNNILRTGTYLSWGNVEANPTPGGTPSTPIPATGPDYSYTLNNGWTLTPRSDNTHPWVEPSFTVVQPTLPLAPGSIPPVATALDYGNSSYRYTITFYKSGDWLPLVLGMLNETGSWVAVPWPTTLQTTGAVKVVPGPPRQFSPNTAAVAQLLKNTSTTAAVPASFTLTAYDNYGNPVAPGTNATFEVVMRNQQNYYTVPITSQQLGNGVTQFNFMSAWAGDFDLLITLHPGDGSPDITPAPAIVHIDTATCAGEDPTKPYRCPDRSCQASYAQCPGISSSNCALNGKVTCADGSCQTSATLCPCPTGQERCPSGNCLAVGTCAPANSVCPTGQVMCMNGNTPTGQCRQSQNDCPAPAVCPPGYLVCPSGVDCARNASLCPDLSTVVCPGSMKQCPTGVCAATSSDCPTPITCPSNQVLCLTDYSCQVDAAHCPDQYVCYSPNTYRCPGSGICATSATQCPSSVTCKSGWVACQSGQCAQTVSQCPAPEPCSLANVVCPDGSCEPNRLFCPSVTSCDPSTPVRCWDGSCVTFATSCTTPQACSTNVTCPGGACANSFALCPTGTTCANDHPVLCPDGSCQASKALCTSIPACPTDQPVRCPDGQSCRGSRTDCPTIVSCPVSGSVKCSDGTCALALDQCAPVTNCPSPLLRCPGGECIADSTALCPTHETCAADYAKCLDGTCRTQCPTTYQTCPSGQVTCPQAAAGVQCALNLTSCPQQPTCPPGYPVRCFDASCASTVGNCPVPPTQFPINKIPCGDGTWATTIQNCPTPLTCPSATPAKCTDNSCRVTAADCPLTKLCDASHPYLCSTGACVANPWDPECTSSSAPCPLSAPVACAPYGSGKCVANVTVCDSTTTAPLNCTGASCTVCGGSQVYCRSGSCVNDDTYCLNVTCDPSIPVQCSDGACVKDASTCNDPVTGCPIGLARCPNNLQCVKDITDTTQCPTNGTNCGAGINFCPDGSCPLNGVSSCPAANGCFGGKKRCYDGSCVTDITDCTAAAPPTDSSGGSVAYPAMCQPANPYKCADGYCAKTSTACPPQLVNLGCSGSTPIQCATGSCVGSALQCPPLNPTCPTGTVRCSSDASCRANGTCPLYSNCPYRCDNGICASSASFCTIDPFSGCPGGTFKCNQTGECVTNLANCVVLSNPNGCPSTSPVKCPNGVCTTSTTLCPVGPSGSCPQSAPILCADGTCRTLCDSSVTQTCNAALGNVRCADGTCAQSDAACNTYNGCNGTYPYRCIDGTCAKQAAGSNSPDACKLSVACSAGLYLCMDGGCVATPSLCQPLLCSGGTTYCNFGCYSNCTAAATQCPAKSPILCNNGACVATPALCGTSPTGGNANGDCANPTPYVCARDGKCVANQNQCPTTTGSASGNPIGNAGDGQNANTGCGSGSVMCPDGQCLPAGRSWACGIIPACPYKTYRWWDGSCQNTTNGPSTKTCVASGTVRCEDGWCRDHKLGYDGCTNNKLAWYQCPNRNCADGPGSCSWVSSGNPTTYPRFDTSCQYQYGACRRLLATTTKPAPCIPDATKECCATTHAGGSSGLIEATVDVSKTSTLPIALNKDLVSIASITIPSGAFSLTNGAATTSISIRAVPASRIRYAVNEIVPSRRQDYGSYLDFPTTVISVPFECVLPPEVKPQFTLNLTYTAWIDLTPPVIDYADVCLARLIELQGFSTWECLIGDRALRNVSSSFYVHKTGAASQEVTSVFGSCAPSSAPGVISPYNGSVYAFIFSPVPEAPTSPAGLDVVQRNIVWIVLGILLGFALIILLAYCAFRLFRYREKYHTEREEADRLQEEVENMKQFGGDSGNKDDQVAMTANPLAVQLKDVQARYNEEELKLQQAEASLRKQEGEIRAQHIDNMRDNRNKLAQELEKLKAQLAEAQAASQPKATFEEHDGPTYTGDEPVREEFDSGTTSVAPKRGKKDL